MKTKIMSTYGVPKSFRDDINYFDSITRDQINTITQLLSKLKSFRDLNDNQIRLEISEKTGLSADKFLPALRALNYIANILPQFNDNIDDFIQDLVTENIITKPSSENLRTAFINLLGKPIFRIPLSTESAYEGILPVFQSAITKCLLLSTFEKEYDLNDSLSVYSPNVAFLLPATILNITIDGPEGEKDISFAITEPYLDKFITQLQLSKKQLENLKSYIKPLQKE